MENKTNEFTSEMDIKIKESIEKLDKMIYENADFLICKLSFILKMNEDFYKKYELTNSISFIVDCVPGKASVNYLYEGIIIEPENLWIRGDNYHHVTLLDILHESIEQKTWKPNIIPLETGEKIRK